MSARRAVSQRFASRSMRGRVRRSGPGWRSRPWGGPGRFATLWLGRDCSASNRRLAQKFDRLGIATGPMQDLPDGLDGRTNQGWISRARRAEASASSDRSDSSRTEDLST